MTEYQFHWWSPEKQQSPAPKARFEAESTLHGAALALRHFSQVGYDIAAPLAHLDTIEPDGVTHMLLIEEVLDWLNKPQQTAFVQREGLSGLFH